MKTVGPLRVLGGPFRQVGDRWTRVHRHRHLNVAVLGCLFVMFGLVIALVLAVRSIDAETTRSLGESTELAHLARDLNETSDLLRRYETGSDGLADRLAALREEITARSSDIEFDDPGQRIELEHLVQQVTTVIDTAGQITSALTPIDETARRLERLAIRVAVDSESATGDAVDELDRWFRLIQVVAGLAAVVFTVAVATVILPLDARDCAAHAGHSGRRRVGRGSDRGARVQRRLAGARPGGARAPGRTAPRRLEQRPPEGHGCPRGQRWPRLRRGVAVVLPGGPARDDDGLRGLVLDPVVPPAGRAVDPLFGRVLTPHLHGPTDGGAPHHGAGRCSTGS